MRHQLKTPAKKTWVSANLFPFMASMIYGTQLSIIVLKPKLASFDFLAKFYIGRVIQGETRLSFLCSESIHLADFPSKSNNFVRQIPVTVVFSADYIQIKILCINVINKENKKY
jgi:hypothetical protein